MGRVNRAIELLEGRHTLIYGGSGDLSYEGGVNACHTDNDFLLLEQEHVALNILGVREFMRGLAAAGPTKSGHPTPTVLVTLPVQGTDEHVMRANAWMVTHYLDCGVHGFVLCHAETPGAVKVLIESMRFPFNNIGVGEGLAEGRRGAGGGPGHIWGLEHSEYLRKADVWPLNPEGELIVGLKIENRRALENCEATCKVPGLTYVEWGPGDMGYSFGDPDAHDPPYSPEMAGARARVNAARKAAGIDFCDSINVDNYKEQIDNDILICGGGPEIAALCREYTKRTMPA